MKLFSAHSLLVLLLLVSAIGAFLKDKKIVLPTNSKTGTLEIQTIEERSLEFNDPSQELLSSDLPGSSEKWQELEDTSKSLGAEHLHVEFSEFEKKVVKRNPDDPPSYVFITTNNRTKAMYRYFDGTTLWESHTYLNR